MAINVVSLRFRLNRDSSISVFLVINYIERVEDLLIIFSSCSFTCGTELLQESSWPLQLDVAEALQINVPEEDVVHHTDHDIRCVHNLFNLHIGFVNCLHLL